ncbi:MAG: response regulator [Deltaproteobacteria bacterium]|nr:response regulator [Deltaproteobacteria bacterium]MBW2015353.1 response regulator [Deltaproteobacteria bacterium]MBW2129654.1 response regulator [Deltaproteobacteria bacterium]MBW2303069.1 response regulator [Deltaproteobacteria bacterium]
MNEDIRILVVDDERAIREGCRRLLGGKGYQVETAENGLKALDIMASNSPDIVLLDLKMPNMGGEEALEIIRNRHPEVPVIIITGHGTVDTAVECMKKGAYDFITKPFQVDQFLITIHRAAEKRRLELQTRLFREENLRNLYDLSLEKSRLKTIINCMADGVLVTNRNMEVVLHNPALLRLLEIPEKIDFPAPIQEIIKDESLVRTLQEVQQHDEHKGEFRLQELQVGDRVLRAVSAPAVAADQDGDYSVVGMVTVIEDITLFKRLDQMKTDFVNMVAHELRSPLVSIRQLNSVLLEGLAGPLREKQKNYIERSMKKIDNLLDLINDLLHIAKLEDGVFERPPVEVDLKRVIEETCGLMESRARNQGVELSYTCEDIGTIKADPKNVEEIINNLISNAVNYSPHGGKVEVCARRLRDQVEITVSDTGIGIAPEELPKIFEKFYRVKHPETRRITGTGLGLSIVKTIVESCNGKIEVDSVPNKGTTFRIFLPAEA